MAYAEVADVESAAGRLGAAWDLQTTPGHPAIQRFLDNCSGIVDAILASQGLGVPVTADPPLTALRALVTDGALSLTARATFPGDSTPGGVKPLIDDATKRWNDSLLTLRSGKNEIVGALIAMGAAPGATDFWTENPDYGMPGSSFVAPNVVNPYLAPGIGRTDRF